MKTLKSFEIDQRYDAVLVGTGIMSATLAVLLHELEPQMSILMVERLNSLALESSSATNNSGTGHAANCELNYTPLNSDGIVGIQKALDINVSFERSLEFWASLSEMGRLSTEKFLNVLPHISFVWRQADIDFLEKRFRALREEVAFETMEWSQDRGELKEWMPLVMEGREADQKFAATRVTRGTDVDFGALASSYISSLAQFESIDLMLSTEVTNLERTGNNLWEISLKGEKGSLSIQSEFVFLGAGGGALTLLQKSGIPESKQYGGFPVSGQWLVCNEENLVSNHTAKVYGNAEVGSPPMSVPHLDTRWINGKRSLLFGPFAGFNTKFLKYGSNWDLFRSLKPRNIFPMIQVGLENFNLIKYLLNQIDLNEQNRLEILRKFFPLAQIDDWKLSIAGQRVQIIKSTRKGGILKMGTEVVSASDGSIAALLGASPGASTAVTIMLEVLQRCWSEKMNSQAWRERLKRLIPSFGNDLNADKELLLKVRQRNNDLLNLS